MGSMLLFLLLLSLPLITHAHTLNPGPSIKLPILSDPSKVERRVAKFLYRSTTLHSYSDERFAIFYLTSKRNDPSIDPMPDYFLGLWAKLIDESDMKALMAAIEFDPHGYAGVALLALAPHLEKSQLEHLQLTRYTLLAILGYSRHTHLAAPFLRSLPSKLINQHKKDLMTFIGNNQRLWPALKYSLSELHPLFPHFVRLFHYGTMINVEKNQLMRHNSVYQVVTLFKTTYPFIRDYSDRRIGHYIPVDLVPFRFGTFHLRSSDFFTITANALDALVQYAEYVQRNYGYNFFMEMGRSLLYADVIQLRDNHPTVLARLIPYINPVLARQFLFVPMLLLSNTGVI